MRMRPAPLHHKRTTWTSWGCTWRRGPCPPPMPLAAPPAMQTCSAACSGPQILLHRELQGACLTGTRPCSLAARPLPLAHRPPPRMVGAAAGSGLPFRHLAPSQGGRWSALPPTRGPGALGGLSQGECHGLSVPGSARAHARPLGVTAADPFGLLLLPPDTDAPPSSQPDLFGEFLNSDASAAQPAPFPSTHSAPPPACGTDFLHLGEGGLLSWGRTGGHGHGSCLPQDGGAASVCAVHPAGFRGPGGRFGGVGVWLGAAGGGPWRNSQVRNLLDAGLSTTLSMPTC